MAYKRYHGAVYSVVSALEFEKHYRYCIKLRPFQIIGKYDDSHNDKVAYSKINIWFTHWIQANVNTIYLTYKNVKGIWVNIVCNIDKPEGDALEDHYDGGTAYRIFQQNVHLNNLAGNKMFGHVDPITNKFTFIIKNLGVNPVEKLPLGATIKNVYGYDMHAAFLAGCKGDFPDTTKDPRYLGLLKEGYIGFNIDGSVVRTVGEPCFVSFPVTKLPTLEAWADKMDAKILAARQAGDKQRKKDLKNIYTYAIGIMAKHNPFVRNVIIDNCLLAMKKYMNDDTIYSVTDSIYSTTKRDDLPIGEHIGEFSYEGCYDFERTSAGYHWGAKKSERGAKKTARKILDYPVVESATELTQLMRRRFINEIQNTKKA